jgi:hypothetical protein
LHYDKNDLCRNQRDGGPRRLHAINVARHEIPILMRARCVEVTEFGESPISAPVSRPRAATSTKNWSGVLGLAGTVILHAIAVHAFLSGATVHKTKRLDLEGGGGSAPPASELVLIQSLNVPRAEEDQFVSLSMRLTAVGLLRMNLDRLPALDMPRIDDGDAENSAHSPPNLGDPAIRALMYGRYTGQISARVERAWMRPQSPVAGSGTEPSSGAIAGDIFRCVVQIRQDDKGNVQEVLLIDCNGTEAWRHSLVVAINQSSPLPAPPIPSVFKRALTMTFEGYSSANGEAPGAAEPVRSDQ